MTDFELKEYEILSEDRRRAIEIFLKGMLIAIGIIAYGFTILYNSNNFFSLILIGPSGIAIGITGIFSWTYCFKHISKLENNLNNICANKNYKNIISTKYIFKTSLIILIIIGIVWLMMIIIKITQLT